MAISIDWDPEKSCILRGHSSGGGYGDPFNWIMKARFYEDDKVFLTGLCVPKGCQFTIADATELKELIRNEFKSKRFRFDRAIKGQLIRREYD